APALPHRGLSPKGDTSLAGLVRIPKLGQVLADQAGELDEIVHLVQEQGIAITERSKGAIQHSLVPCSLNLETLVRTFPVIPDEANERMRRQDDLLRDIVTLQYNDYLNRFAAGKTPSGSEFSRALFQIEGMAGTIREIRKTARLLGTRAK
ncbi:hypothetical protein, partial [Methanoregula sp.]|uniref:hypothetical protein n=1 Tax=Methanoregula sp. TaxID=2052170 RepID=UPI000CAA122F